MKLKIYNKILNPDLWNKGKTLKSDVRLYLLKISKDFYLSTELKQDICDILLLGSNVNFTWTENSDIDIHIVIDITKEGLDPEHFRKFLDSLSGKFNEEHDIFIKGHKVEVYLQDITEKNSTPEKARPHGAMFSLLHNKWLISPKNEQPVLDKESIKKAFYEIKEQIDKIIETRNIDGLKILMKSIRDYRNKGLESKDGEFSTENIVFKALRHTGLLEKLKNSINSIYDRLVSLEEMESYLNKLNDLDEGVVNELIEETIEHLEEKDKPYIIIGGVDSNGKVAVIKQEKIKKPMGEYQPFKSHGMLYRGDYDIDPNTSISWRYRSDINELMYYDYPSESQSIAVKQYLRNNCKMIESPRVVLASELSREHEKSFHDLDYQYQKINEIIDKNDIIKKPFIIVGMVFDDLSVKASIDYEGSIGSFSHSKVRHKTHDMYGGIRFRYNSNDNTIYWWPAEYEKLKDDQKDAVIKYLEDEYDIIDPEQESSIEKYRSRGHMLDEDKFDLFKDL